MIEKPIEIRRMIETLEDWLSRANDVANSPGYRHHGNASSSLAIS